MSLLHTLLKETPYTLEPREVNIVEWLFRMKPFTILFEGEPLITFHGIVEEAERQVHMLNAAWRLGASSGYIQGTTDAKYQEE